MEANDPVDKLEMWRRRFRPLTAEILPDPMRDQIRARLAAEPVPTAPRRHHWPKALIPWGSVAAAVIVSVVTLSRLTAPGTALPNFASKASSAAGLAPVLAPTQHVPSNQRVFAPAGPARASLTTPALVGPWVTLGQRVFWLSAQAPTHLRPPMSALPWPRVFRIPHRSPRQAVAVQIGGSLWIARFAYPRYFVWHRRRYRVTPSLRPTHPTLSIGHLGPYAICRLQGVPLSHQVALLSPWAPPLSATVVR